MSQQVARKPTPVGSQDITSAIITAWQQVFGNKPKLSQVAKAWAQIAAETNGGKAMFNYNVGNITWTNGNSHDRFQNTDSRSKNGNPSERVWYKTFFRAYPSLVDGIADYLMFLKNRPAVLEALMKGSPQDFSAALASVKYYDPYTRDDYVDKNGKKVGGYTSALTSRYKSFVADYRKGKISGATKPSQSELTKSEPQQGGIVDAFLSKLNDFVSKIVGASEKTHLLVIQSQDDLVSKIEYARVLQYALNEELGVKSNIYANQNNVDIEIISNYDDASSEKAILEIANAISDTFSYAIKKFASVKIQSTLMLNTKSILPELDAKTAEKQYRMFNLKIIKGQNGN